VFVVVHYSVSAHGENASSASTTRQFTATFIRHHSGLSRSLLLLFISTNRFSVFAVLQLFSAADE